MGTQRARACLRWSIRSDPLELVMMEQLEDDMNVFIDDPITNVTV